MPRYAAFLSYAREDTQTVDAIQKALAERNIATWLDVGGIVGGDVWEATIRRALTQSDTLLVFVSASTVGSFVEKEVALARDMRKPIIPLVFDDTIEAENEFGQTLRKYHYVDLRQRAEIPIGEIEHAIRRGHHAPVLASYNIKGGVGKTTIAVNVGAALYKRMNKRVLLVDMDPQTNLSTALVPPQTSNSKSGFLSKSRGPAQRVDVLGALRASRRSIIGVLDESVRIADQPEAEFDLGRFIYNLAGENVGPALDLVVGDSALKNLATTARPIDVGRARRGFARFVGQCRRNYDCIILDLNPSISAISLCALDATTHILSPVRPDAYSLQGLNLLDDISTENDAEARGCEQIILINDPREDKKGVVRKFISESKYRDRLLSNDLVYSKYFYANPKPSVKGALTRLSAFGEWGEMPRSDRQSLENVTVEIAQRLGLQA
jgi:chromosome partitioning protein